MRHHHLSHVCAALALTSFAACTNDEDEDQTIVAFGSYDENADFSAYKTYDVVEPDDVPADKQSPKSYLEANRVAVIHSIMYEMTARGYVLDENDPDLRISPLVRMQDVEVTVVQPSWYDYYYGYYWGYGYPWYNADIVHLQAGTLIIDAVDVGDPKEDSDDKLVFRGYVKAILPDQPTDVSAQIPEVVAKIFSYWPKVDKHDDAGG